MEFLINPGMVTPAPTLDADRGDSERAAVDVARATVVSWHSSGCIGCMSTCHSPAIGAAGNIIILYYTIYTVLYIIRPRTRCIIQPWPQQLRVGHKTILSPRCEHLVRPLGHVVSTCSSVVQRALSRVISTVCVCMCIKCELSGKLHTIR